MAWPQALRNYLDMYTIECSVRTNTFMKLKLLTMLIELTTGDVELDYDYDMIHAMCCIYQLLLFGSEVSIDR